MDYKKTFNEWKKLTLGAEVAAELADIESDEAEIKSRFSSELCFGTAGLRGKLGAGTNRINVYTIGRATQGLAEYIIRNGGQKRGMAVAYDTRRNSALFAKTAALVFAGNGIKTYLFNEETSVPELSFAIKHIGAFGGVVITASHNPKDYNGYKVYAPWGGQLLADASQNVMGCIEGVCGMSEVITMDMDEAIQKGLLTIIGEEIDNEYYNRLAGMAKAPDLIEKHGGGIHFVYTPLFGTGLRTVEGVMKGLPYKYSLVEEQCESDPDFPGLKAPNPEDETAMEKAVKLAQEVCADMAFGTDPDADRMGVAVRNEQGEFVMLSGNQIGCLIADYLLRQRKEAGELNASDYIVKSFVSTTMADKIAEEQGATCITVPTGFKYIADVINTRKEGTFIFGFEESCGFLAGDFVMDKDGVMAMLLMLEVACECRESGETLYQRLRALYDTHGWHKEKVISAVMEGQGGMEKIGAIMKRLRETPPETLGRQSVISNIDYQRGTYKDADGITEIDFPCENALKFELESGWVCVRPSGTEPKIKLYVAVWGDTQEEAQRHFTALEEDARAAIRV